MSKGALAFVAIDKETLVNNTNTSSSVIRVFPGKYHVGCCDETFNRLNTISGDEPTV